MVVAPAKHESALLDQLEVKVVAALPAPAANPELVETSGRIVTLARLGVDLNAVVVLLLASVIASVDHVVAWVLGALAAVLLRVALEGVLVVLIREVIAGDDGHLDSANRLAGAVAVHRARGLLADVGRRGNRALRHSGRRLGRGSSLSGSGLGRGDLSSRSLSGLGGHRRAASSDDCGRGRGLLDRGLGRLVIAETKLRAATAGLAAVVVDILAPLGEVEALERRRPSGLGEAVGNLDLAVRKAVLAALVVVPLGEGI